MGGRGSSSGKTWTDSQSRKAMSEVFSLADKLEKAVERQERASNDGLPITDNAAYQKLVDGMSRAKEAWEAKRNLFFSKSTDAVYNEYASEVERREKEQQEKLRKEYEKRKRNLPPNRNPWNIL